MFAEYNVFLCAHAHEFLQKKKKGGKLKQQTF